MDNKENTWIYYLETTIYSLVKSLVEADLKATYPTIVITNEGKSNKEAEFPTAYIHELPGVETGCDIDGIGVNAVMETFQVDVSTNTSKRDAKYIANIIASAFKKLRFQIVSMPEIEYGDETYRCVARFRRVIGANDTLL